LARLVHTYARVRIFIIEDDKLIRWVLREICVQEGHDVMDAADAESAFREMESGFYDIIFADLETETFDAQEITEKIRVHQPNASVILLSARPGREIEPLLKNISFFGIVGKPFDASVVRSFIENVSYKPNLLA
jgi:DNA-binding response OmpR family regulator